MRTQPLINKEGIAGLVQAPSRVPRGVPTLAHPCPLSTSDFAYPAIAGMSSEDSRMAGILSQDSMRTHVVPIQYALAQEAFDSKRRRMRNAKHSGLI